MLPSVAVVGATGAVGEIMRQVLDERSFPFRSIKFLASERSAGKPLTFKGKSYTVEPIRPEAFAGVEVVLSSTPASVSREYSPVAARAGAVVIDNSSAWRMDPDVPLVVPEVNAAALDHTPKGIVANPNCTTMVAMPALKALHDATGLRRVIVSTYQSVSGAGLKGVDELAEQVAKVAEQSPALTFDGAAVEFPDPTVFPGPIAFNVLPHAGDFVDDETNEEKKFRDESRKILGIPDLPVSCTCVRVPVYTGHSLSLHVEFERPLLPDEARVILSTAPGVALADVPTPLLAAGSDQCYVGRIRRDPGAETGLALFISGDNLRKGAALNAVQIAEALFERGRLTA